MGKWTRDEWDLIGENVLGKRIRGMPVQHYDEASDHKNYELGSRLVVDDRSFRYGRAGNNLDCQFGAHIGFGQDVNFRDVTVDAAAAGKYSLVVTVTADDGRLGTGEFAVNELRGGYIIIFPDGMADVINRRVVSNSAVAAPGGVMTVTIDRPLPVNLTPAPHAEIIACPYLDVLLGNYDRHAIMGMPPVAATAGQYLWLQTWGPVWCVPGGVTWATADCCMAMFAGNGGIEAFDEALPVVGTDQMAGYIMTPLPAASGGGSGAPFLWLMLAP